MKLTNTLSKGPQCQRSRWKAQPRPLGSRYRHRSTAEAPDRRAVQASQHPGLVDRAAPGFLLGQR